MKRTLLAVAVVTVAVFSTANLTKGAASKNIPVCHIPPGNLSNAHEIDIDASALPAHIGVHCAALPDGAKVCDYRMDDPTSTQGGRPQELGSNPCGFITR
jgi:hypothetical protein